MKTALGAQPPAARCPARSSSSSGGRRQRVGAPCGAQGGAVRLQQCHAARRREEQRRHHRRPLAVSCSAVVSPQWTLDSYEEELGWRSDFNTCYQTDAAPIGQGSFGSVYRGVSRSTGKEVAVKVLPKVRGKLSREKTLEKLARECDCVERLQGCPGVVQLEDVFEDADAVSIVTELCSGGDLQQFTEARGGLNERALAHVAFEVLKIVKACHDAGMLHGDVKPANFCLKHPTHNPLASPQLDWSTGATAWLKAIDFGCSQNLPVHRYLTKRTGTPVFMAPEVYGRAYHREADMWSVGVMLYQLFARRFPFWDTMEGCKSSQLDEVARAVQTADISYNYGPWATMSAEGRAFVAACLQRDPTQRLTVEQALQHPWLARMLNRSPAAAAAAAAPAAAAAAVPSYEQQQQYQYQQQYEQVVQQTQQVMASVRAPQYQQAVARVRASPNPQQPSVVASGPTPYAPQKQQQHALHAWHLYQQQQYQEQQLLQLQQQQQQQQQQEKHSSSSSRVAAAQAA